MVCEMLCEMVCRMLSKMKQSVADPGFLPGVGANPPGCTYT